MSQTNPPTSILEFDQGSMMERFNYELQRALANILDLNTPAGKAREVSLVMKLESSPDRRQVSYSTVVKSKLQPTNPIMGGMAVLPEAEQVTVYEMVPQVPGQTAMQGAEAPQPKVIEFKKEA